MEVQVISNTVQKFNGKSYYLCGNYFQRKGERLHRTVWEYHNGAIPDGYHVHHVDGDRSHNNIENLELLKGHDHLSKHMTEPDRVEKSRRSVQIASKAASKWHGSEAGLEFHSDLGKANWEKREVQTYTCTQCGKTFQTKHVYGKRDNHFCSNACKTRFRAKSGVDDEERVCPICGKTYTVNRYSKAQTCSPECARKRRWGK